MIVFYKLRKKKVIPLTILIIKKNKEFFIKIYHFKQNLINTSHILF